MRIILIIFIILFVVFLITEYAKYWPLAILIVAAIWIWRRKGNKGEVDRVERVNFGDPYERVWKFARRNATKWHSYSDKSISVEMEWFDDGDIYDVYFSFDDDRKLKGISVSIKEYISKDTYDSSYWNGAMLDKGARIISYLKSEYGVSFADGVDNISINNRKEFGYSESLHLSAYLRTELNHSTQYITGEQSRDVYYCKYAIYFTHDDR